MSSSDRTWWHDCSDKDLARDFFTRNKLAEGITAFCEKKQRLTLVHSHPELPELFRQPFVLDQHHIVVQSLPNASSPVLRLAVPGFAIPVSFSRKEDRTLDLPPCLYLSTKDGSYDTAVAGPRHVPFPARGHRVVPQEWPAAAFADQPFQHVGGVWTQLPSEERDDRRWGSPISANSTTWSWELRVHSASKGMHLPAPMTAQVQVTFYLSDWWEFLRQNNPGLVQPRVDISPLVRDFYHEAAYTMPQLPIPRVQPMPEYGPPTVHNNGRIQLSVFGFALPAVVAGDTASLIDGDANNLSAVAAPRFIRHYDRHGEDISTDFVKALLNDEFFFAPARQTRIWWYQLGGSTRESGMPESADAQWLLSFGHVTLEGIKLCIQVKVTFVPPWQAALAAKFGERWSQPVDFTWLMFATQLLRRAAPEGPEPPVLELTPLDHIVGHHYVPKASCQVGHLSASWKQLLFQSTETVHLESGISWTPLIARSDDASALPGMWRFQWLMVHQNAKWKVTADVQFVEVHHQFVPGPRTGGQPPAVFRHM
ncbi:hypothetical protein JCM1840_000256 [Sporobolomyces johnsonii]